MSEKIDQGGPAIVNHYTDGLYLRDLLALTHFVVFKINIPSVAARNAYEFADAMIAAKRAKK